MRESLRCVDRPSPGTGELHESRDLRQCRTRTNYAAGTRPWVPARAAQSSVRANRPPGWAMTETKCPFWALRGHIRSIPITVTIATWTCCGGCRGQAQDFSSAPSLTSTKPSWIACLLRF